MSASNPDRAASRPMSATEWGLLLALAVVWGGSFFFNGVALRELPVFTVVVARVALAALTLSAILFGRGQRLARRPMVWRSLFIMALLNNALPFSLIVWAQQRLPSGTAAILNAATPLFAVLSAHLLTRDEKANGWKFVGVVTGFIGVAAMLGLSSSEGATQVHGAGVTRVTSTLIPALACLAGAASYALAGIFGRRFRALGLSPMSTATGQLIAATVLMLPVALLADQPWQLPMPGATTLAALVGLAGLSTALAYVLYFRILASAGATNLLLVTFLIPVTAVLLGTSVLGEHFGPQQLGGMLLIGLGLLAIDGRLAARYRRAFEPDAGAWSLTPRHRARGVRPEPGVLRDPATTEDARHAVAEYHERDEMLAEKAGSRIEKKIKLKA